MNEVEFLKKFKEEILDTEDEVVMDTKLACLPEWDSLSLVSFIASVKVTKGKTLDREEVLAAQTVRDLFEFFGK